MVILHKYKQRVIMQSLRPHWYSYEFFPEFSLKSSYGRHIATQELTYYDNKQSDPKTIKFLQDRILMHNWRYFVKENLN